eukprot:gene3888-2586_t
MELAGNGFGADDAAVLRDGLAPLKALWGRGPAR